MVSLYQTCRCLLKACVILHKPESYMLLAWQYKVRLYVSCVKTACRLLQMRCGFVSHAGCLCMCVYIILCCVVYIVEAVIMLKTVDIWRNLQLPLLRLKWVSYKWQQWKTHQRWNCCFTLSWTLVIVTEEPTSFALWTVYIRPTAHDMQSNCEGVWSQTPECTSCYPHRSEWPWLRIHCIRCVSL
jgi:hypothetical protein